MFRQVVFVVSFVLASSAGPALADDYIKDGRACLKELCLGDDLAALSSVNWETATSPAAEREDTTVGKRPVGRGETNRVKKRFQGDVSDIIAYLADGRFDSDALPGLAKITAACQTHTLQGTFTTGSGNPTTVFLVMAPDPAAPNAQRWQVRRITRKIPGVATSEQATGAKKMLEERYAPFTSRNRKGVGDMLQVNNFSGFQFTLSEPAIPNEAAKLKQHVACGGNGGGAVSLD